jgi:hypothetical protein
MGCTITYSMGNYLGVVDLVATTTSSNEFGTVYQQTTGTFNSRSRIDVALFISVNCPNGGLITLPNNGQIIFDDITFTTGP